MPAEPLKILLRGGDTDCAITAISLFSNAEYVDVVAAVCRLDPANGKNGLTKHLIRSTMAALGQPVRYTKHIDYEDHYGLLFVWHPRSKEGHLTVLKQGQVIEAAATWCGVWSVEEYLKVKEYQPEGIFLSKES